RRLRPAREAEVEDLAHVVVHLGHALAEVVELEVEVADAHVVELYALDGPVVEVDRVGEGAIFSSLPTPCPSSPQKCVIRKPEWWPRTASRPPHRAVSRGSERRARCPSTPAPGRRS